MKLAEYLQSMTDAHLRKVIRWIARELDRRDAAAEQKNAWNVDDTLSGIELEELHTRKKIR